MKTKRKTNRVFQGAMILSISSLIAKILSAVYRIPFQNLVGNTGFYVYQQVYPIYGIGMTIGLSGLPVFISKVIAEQATLSDQRAVTRRLVEILTPVSLFITFGLWVLAPEIAMLMGDHSLTPIIQSVALMFLILPVTSITRGYRQGQYSMVPTSVSQVIEQIIRVAVVIVVAVTAVNAHWNIYKMGTWAMAGATAGGLGASLVLWPAFVGIFKSGQGHSSVHLLHLGRRMFVEGGLICLFASLIVLLQLVDSFTVQQALISTGMHSDAAKNLKGIFDRGQPLIQLGLVVATSISASLIPALTASYLKRREVEFQRVYRSLTHLCSALAVLSTAGIIALMPEINTLLFENAQGSFALSINMVSIVLISLITTYSSVLQSINQFRATFVALVSGVVVKLLLNYSLTEQFGIAGASLGTVLSLAVTLLIIWFRMPQELREPADGRHFNYKLVLILVGMVVAVLATKLATEGLIGITRTAMLVNVFVPIIVGVGVSVFLTIKLNLFTVKEMLVIPGGKKILELINHSKTEE